MTDTPHRSADPAALALPGDGPALDAHGFDPAAYDWIPVRRVPRHDGWSAEKQRLFVGTLAAREVGMSAKSAYALRRAPDGAGFARAWTRRSGGRWTGWSTSASTARWRGRRSRCSIARAG